MDGRRPATGIMMLYYKVGNGGYSFSSPSLFGIAALQLTLAQSFSTSSILELQCL